MNGQPQKQLDGVFDTDGRLLYDETTQKIVYVYFYRNQFIAAGKDAELISRSRTIDTTSHARLKVSYVKNSTERKMSAPPYIVNAGACRLWKSSFYPFESEREISG
ncbi:hypothetical protein ACQ9BO_09335 [Flavobacterium sp. P21]|uniref:hypothetical protein n=1 Tax=Flavobacterium sp. P21 TaxID=3423948 RepID=UPI003D663EBB